MNLRSWLQDIDNRHWQGDISQYWYHCGVRISRKGVLLSDGSFVWSGILLNHCLHSNGWTGSGPCWKLPVFGDGCSAYSSYDSVNICIMIIVTVTQLEDNRYEFCLALGQVFIWIHYQCIHNERGRVWYVHILLLRCLALTVPHITADVISYYFPYVYD